MSGRKIAYGADGLPKWKNSREVARIVHRGNGLRLVMLGCGKANCCKCNGKHRGPQEPGGRRRGTVRSLYAVENEARVRFGKDEDWNVNRKPLHGPYWYLLRYVGRHARHWAIGRVLFGKKLKNHTDKEAVVVSVLRGAGVKIGANDFGWEPDGWTDEDRATIGGMSAEMKGVISRS